MKSLRTDDSLRSFSAYRAAASGACSGDGSPSSRLVRRGTIIATPSQASGGFTLLELLVVVVIMAIVVSITAVDLSHLMGRFRLNGAARELASVVDLCRTSAITSNVEFALVLVESDPEPDDGVTTANRGRYEVRVANPATTPVSWALTQDGVYDLFAGPNERMGVSIEVWEPLLGAPGYSLPDAIVFSPRGYLLNDPQDFTGGVIRVVLRNKSAPFVEQRIVRINRGGSARIAAGG